MQSNFYHSVAANPSFVSSHYHIFPDDVCVEPCFSIIKIITRNFPFLSSFFLHKIPTRACPGATGAELQCRASVFPCRRASVCPGGRWTWRPPSRPRPPASRSPPWRTRGTWTRPSFPGRSTGRALPCACGTPEIFGCSRGSVGDPYGWLKNWLKLFGGVWIFKI